MELGFFELYMVIINMAQNMDIDSLDEHDQSGSNIGAEERLLEYAPPPDKCLEEGPFEHVTPRIINPRKGRGPTRCLKIKKADKTNLLWDRYIRPTGPSKDEFASMLGTLAKSNCNINQYWSQVEQKKKDLMWQAVRDRYQIPDEAKKTVMSLIASRAKGFRHELVMGWISNKRKRKNKVDPWVLYEGFITKQDWDIFVATRTSEDFKRIQKQARENREKNIHQHHMGRKGYTGSIKKWRELGLLKKQNEDGTSSLIEVDDEACKVDCYLLGRQKMNAAGELFFPVKETAILSEKIAAMNDEDNGPSDDDKLTRALGKKDHPGRVRGFGGEVRKGYVSQNTGKRSSGVTRRDLQMLEESLMKEREERRQLEERFRQLEELLRSGGLVQSTPKPTNSTQITTSSPTDPYPFASLEEHKHCHLGLWINGVVAFVAHGIVMKSSSKTPIHCKPLPEYYAKVIVNSVIKGYENQHLPLPTTEMRLLIDAVTSVIPWPISLLFIKEETQEETQEEPLMEKQKVIAKVTQEEPLTKKQKVIAKVTQEKPLTKKQKVIAKVTQEEPLTKKQKVIAKVPQYLPPKLSKQKVIMKKRLIETQKVVDRKRKLLVSEALYMKLSKHMKMLYDKIMQMPSDKTSISLKLPSRVFHYEEDMGVSIGFEDITEVMRWQHVNVSIIQAYEVICSNSICKRAGLAKVITFLCPQLTSFDQAKLERKAFVSYLHRGLLAAKAKRSNFVFIPHHVVNHWVMLIISMNTSTLFVLDPMGRDATKIKILNQIVHSYKKVRLGDDDNPSSIDLKIRHFECPRQMDCVRCGYFVMRYMYDFCTNIHLNFTKSDDTVYEYFHNVGCTYTTKDLGFVREELAQYLMTQYFITQL